MKQTTRRTNWKTTKPRNEPCALRRPAVEKNPLAGRLPEQVEAQKLGDQLGAAMDVIYLMKVGG
jgi:hypothetical protein